MKLRSGVLACVAVISAAVLTSCGGGSKYSYQNVTVTVSPQPTSIPVGTTVTFTATATNAPAYTNWLANDEAFGNAGTLTFTAGSSTLTYTAPATPPIYSGASDSPTQGSVTIVAFVPASLTNVLDDATATVSFVITAPSVTVGISPTTASVALNATQQFTGYAVGSVNNALTWQVNGVTGGSVQYGSISATGLYTAPAAVPITSDTVTITAVSQADPTKSASAVVTLP